MSNIVVTCEGSTPDIHTDRGTRDLVTAIRRASRADGAVYRIEAEGRKLVVWCGAVKAVRS